MITSVKFEGMLEIARKGIASKVTVTADIIRGTKFETVADEVTKSVQLIQGNSVIVLTEEFGVQSEVNMTLFFIDGGQVIEITSGQLYMKDKKGNVYSIDDKGVVTFISLKDASKIWWVTDTYLYDLAVTQMKYRYGVFNSQALSYVNNLAFDLNLQRVATSIVRGAVSDVVCTRVKFINYYSDLGLDIFKFTRYNNGTVIPTIPKDVLDYVCVCDIDAGLSIGAAINLTEEEEEEVAVVPLDDTYDECDD